MRLNRQIVYVIVAVAAAVPSSVIPAERHFGEPARTLVATPAPQPAGRAAGSTVRLPASLATGSVTSARPVSQEELAIVAIRDDARQRIEALQTRIDASPEGAARQALMREVPRIKQEAELGVLETKLSFANARGDKRAVRQIEEAREWLLHPGVRKASGASSASVARPAPSAPGKGGPR